MSIDHKVNNNQARLEAKWKKPWRPKSWNNLIDNLPVVTIENYMLVLSKLSGSGKYYHPSIYSVLANCYQYTNREKYFIALIMSGDWTAEEELEFMPWVLSIKNNSELQLLSQFPECFKFRSSIHIYPEKTKLFIREHLSSTFMFKRI